MVRRAAQYILDERQRLVLGKLDDHAVGRARGDNDSVAGFGVRDLRHREHGGGGVTKFVETGAGKQLSGMVKRNAPDAEAVALNVPADLEAFVKSLG